MNLKKTAILTTSLALTACNAQVLSAITDSSTASSGSGGSSTGPSGCGDSSTVSSGSGGSPTGPSGSGSCPNPAVQVYTVDSVDGVSYVLHTFDPTTLTFTEVATVVCSSSFEVSPVAIPEAMAIDQHGTAWILSTTLRLYKLDIATGSCVNTPFVGDVIGASGLTWILDPAGSGDQLLYAGGGRVLTNVNLTYGNPATIGGGFGSWSWDGTEDANPALTSAPDGRLFGVWRNAATMRQLDPSTSDVLLTAPLPSIAQGYATAFLDEALLLAGSPVANANSAMFRYDLSTQATTTLVPDTGFVIAAMSIGSCAH